MANNGKRAGEGATATGRDRAQGHKSSGPKARVAGPRKPKLFLKRTPQKRKTSPASETARLKSQLKTARMQQQASAEILRAVANASGDAARPLQLIAETTERLFAASAVSIRIAGPGDDWSHVINVGEGAMRIVAAVSAAQLKISGHNMPAVVYRENRQIHLPDIEKVDPSIADWPGLKPARTAGTRTVVGIPLRREGKAIGALIVHRRRVAAFTNDELALLQSFADQAVIAIENARLFNELTTKSRELGEALQQQTATVEVLEVTSNSPGELEPVFRTVLENATRICDAQFGTLFRFDGKAFYFAADVGTPKALSEQVRRPGPFQGLAGGMIDRIQRSRQVQHTPDYSADANSGLAAKLGGARSTVGVPILRDDILVGAIVIYRQEVRPFTDREIDLVRSFAAQAAIAIENARLFNETKEALERQTATSEILRVISQSPTDVKPVFDAIAQTAVRLLGCDRAFIQRCDSKSFSTAAWCGPEGQLPTLNHSPVPIDPAANFPSRAIVEKKTLYLPDWSTIELPEFERTVHDRLGIRSALYLPLLRSGECIGLLGMAGKRANAFNAKDIVLAEAFRDQALIAIENTRLFNETREALERQTATADILKVIASSPSDVQPVFEAIAARANSLVGGFSASVFRFIDGMAHLMAFTPTTPEADEVLKSTFPSPVDSFPPFRMARDGEVTRIADTETLTDEIRDIARARGFRSMLFAPLMSKGASIGLIAVTRLQTGTFSDHHVQLLRTFADQAVIAIENTRLFNETKEALEQQRATSDILAAINSSGGFLAPVFECILEKAHQLCGAPCGSLQLYQDGQVVPVAIRGMTPAFSEFLRRGYPITEGIRASLFADHPVQRADMVETLREQPDEPSLRAAVELGGVRTMVWVPLLRDGVAFGRIIAARQEVRPFDDKQIATLQGFAAQAVIAIENARLLQELRARTDDLVESLQQQTATADVLKVISRSAFHLQTVLDTLLESAVRLSESRLGALFRLEGGLLHVAAQRNFDERQRKLLLAKYPMPPNHGHLSGRAVLTGAAIQSPDILSDSEYRSVEAKEAGFRSLLGVPLLRDGQAIGSIVIFRTEVGPFTDKQLELIQTFADQAVIAIENARLFNEVQAKTRDLEEALQQQTASADVLKVIGRSAFDLEQVFETVVESSVRLCEAERAIIFRFDGESLRVAHVFNAPHELGLWLEQNPIRPGRQSVAARAALERRTIQIEDVRADHEHTYGAKEIEPFRTVLGVPMLKGDQLLGVILVYHNVVKPFTDKQILLVSTFAEQAAIAIENVRLFDEVQARTRELSQSLDDLRSAQDRLIQTEKLASLGQLTAGIAHEIKNPLNFVNNFSALSTELVDELNDVLKPTALDGKTRDEVDEITKTLKANLEKVVQHGKRADSIVKNMLLHSREGSSERRPSDINAIVEESLNLAYHGARAEKSGFNITLRRDLDPAAGMANLYPQEITRVLLNLISNGFYAASKRREMGENDFEPTLAATTKDLGNQVEIRIRDNGTGIPAEVKEKMFNPFFTTKPAGEGTGLGLSMSHDIVVKQHGGRIDVETEPGAFTEFIITLPRELEVQKDNGGVN